MKTILAVLTVVILTGCGASKYPVTFTSEPSYAALTCNNVSFGYTPVTLYYDLDQIKGDTLPLDCHATYASGLKIKYESNVLFKQYPNGVNAYVYIKKGYPLIQIDERAAMQGAHHRQQIQQQRELQEAKRPAYDWRQDEYKFEPNKMTYCNKIGSQTFCTTH